MSDRTLDLSKLPRRREADVSRLRAKNRQAPIADAPAGNPVATALPAGAETVPTAASVTDQDAPGHASSAARAAGTETTPAETTGQKSKTTVYLDRDVRDRAQTAYRATSHLEQDTSWSHFVQRAIETEVRRREAIHNAEAPYAPSTARLSPGRPVGS